MSEDETGGAGADDLSDWTREWLEERAAEQDVSPGELLKRFAAAFRAAEEGEIPQLVHEDDLDAIGSELDAVETELDELAETVADLSGDVDGVERDVEQKVQDVRERVIQVKREADAKAAADHDHPQLAREAAEAAKAATETKTRLSELADHVDTLDTQVDEGFENFEEILEYLTETVDDVEEKNTRLARAIVSMREGVQGVTEREGRRIAADRLRETANKHGIRTADCEDCGATLDVALLTDARCPHCASTFATIEPSRGFFGSPTLEVGDRPALEAGDVPGAKDIDVSGAVADGNGGPVDVTDILADDHSTGGESAGFATNGGENPSGDDREVDDR